MKFVRYNRVWLYKSFEVWEPRLSLTNHLRVFLARLIFFTMFSTSEFGVIQIIRDTLKGIFFPVPSPVIFNFQIYAFFNLLQSWTEKMRYLTNNFGLKHNKCFQMNKNQSVKKLNSSCDNLLNTLGCHVLFEWHLNSKQMKNLSSVTLLWTLESCWKLHQLIFLNTDIPRYSRDWKRGKTANIS